MNAKILIVLAISSLMTSCLATSNTSSNEQIVPETPVFVEQIEYVEGLEGFCITISQETLWISGTDADTLSNQITSTLEILINNQIVPNDELLIIQPTSIRSIIDENDNVIGQYGSSIIACVSEELISSDTDTLTFEFQDLEGNTRTFSWQPMVSLDS